MLFEQRQLTGCLLRTGNADVDFPLPTAGHDVGVGNVSRIEGALVPGGQLVQLLHGLVDPQRAVGLAGVNRRLHEQRIENIGGALTQVLRSILAPAPCRGAFRQSSDDHSG
ncbi:hypothetical protein D3C87_1775500 [compost metagenome]